ncbi:MAG: hypothetical protein P857_885 [Candidatus Xenolissoclinum pacificiensis L6]|uniref:DDE Tnp4 domain-containing protein n=1 Tax=Candidatus Xenolissoclinum pacificiensis L6 TaxID=1401685 RepID=W2V2R8_9RICK|nr:MAG: hypothetical protein P857_885 [Candidatus Xenolissoclinum pacificiensis L6]
MLIQVFKSIRQNTKYSNKFHNRYDLKKGTLYYSGKKKPHTIKTDVRINDKGRIVQVSKSYPGSIHDFKLFKQQEFPPQDSTVLVDSGYQED